MEGPIQRVREILLQEGLPHLRNQLRSGNVRLVVLNGRQVLDRVRSEDLAILEQTDTLWIRQSGCKLVRCSLYSGVGEGVRFIGWSANLQSSRGISLDFRK